MSCHLR